jgi:hypothetical protein
MPRADYHVALLGCRTAYGRYRNMLQRAERSALVRKLDSAQALIEGLNFTELAKPCIQAAIAELTIPLVGEIGDAWRGSVLAYLLTFRIHITEYLHRGFLETPSLSALAAKEGG